MFFIASHTNKMKVKSGGLVFCQLVCVNMRTMKCMILEGSINPLSDITNLQIGKTQQRIHGEY